jgi:hypothetical protein
MFNEFILPWSFPPPTSGRKPNIPSIFTLLEPKFEIKRIYSPVILGLNVATKSFENSFVLIILPFGSRTVSLSVTFVDSGSECNATDTERAVSLICNAVSRDSLGLTVAWLKTMFSCIN